ncbi:MAG: hypothetical protein HUK24_05490, partial [Sphaerochaetaceae bacterium]|nr:hypothetical protein [Sphaerochaetaceae bacterium]
MKKRVILFLLVLIPIFALYSKDVILLYDSVHGEVTREIPLSWDLNTLNNQEETYNRQLAIASVV